MAVSENENYRQYVDFGKYATEELVKKKVCFQIAEILICAFSTTQFYSVPGAATYVPLAVNDDTNLMPIIQLVIWCQGTNCTIFAAAQREVWIILVSEKQNTWQLSSVAHNDGSH